LMLNAVWPGGKSKRFWFIIIIIYMYDHDKMVLFLLNQIS
jgi:hypothetical protein